VRGLVAGGQTWLNGLPVNGQATPRPTAMSVVSLVTTGNTSADRFGFGNGQAFWWGDLAELIVYDRPLGAEERRRVEEYLLNKYRIGAPVQAPSVSPNGGVFTAPLSVSLETSTPGAEIRYTTDGSEPSASSAPYGGPFLVEATTTVKAKAFVVGSGESATTTVGFISNADGHPGTFSGLRLWWRADAGVPTGQGDLWQDQSGQGNHGGQTWSGATPALVPNVVNGLPAIRFDGNSDHVAFAARLGTIRTVFWVVRQDAAATSDNRSLLGDVAGGARDFEGGFGTPGTIWRADCCVSGLVAGGQTWLNGLPVNGQATPRPTVMSVVSLVTTGNTSADRFGFGNSQAFWWGDLAELIIYDRPLTDVERIQVEDYLNARYGIFLR
jgi:hypothetical protein